MWKIRRPRRSKANKVAGIIGGVGITLLGCMNYYLEGNIGIVVIVIGLVQILFWLFFTVYDRA